MAEKKKMSTAEILAAARKGTAGVGAQPVSEAAATEPAAAEATPPQVHGAEANREATAAPPAAKPKPAAAGGKLSVAEILAKARAEKAGGAAATETASAAKPAAAKAAPAAPAEKPAAKPRPEKVGAAAAISAGPAVRDTSSILAAARAAAKPGPVSKLEAAARLKPSAPAKPAKGETVVPPMPAKPDYAKPKAAKVPVPAGDNRRVFMGVLIGSFLGIGFTAMTLTLSLWTLAFARFMFPNVLTEPPSKFKIGFPSDFPPGVVDEKFKAQFGIWPVNVEYKGLRQIVALKTVCTHLGCTPNWLEAEQKFKCPCHGSGFYKDGINFEGPAPRPLERYAIRLADDGQLEVDKSRTFQEELGQWSDAACYVAV